jgi:hypothetical protein
VKKESVGLHNRTFATNPSPSSKDKEQRQCQSRTGDDLQAGSQRFLRLSETVRHQHIPELIKGVRFIDGVIEQSPDDLKSSANESPATHTEIVA